MKTPKLFLLAILISFGISTMAQVAINNDGSNPNSSSILDLKSTNGGLLLPRMNTFQISYISNPAAGLMVFNTDSSDFYGFNGSEWVSVWNTGDTINVWACGDPIIDSRDGQTYTTIQIGTQCWFAENLNYDTTNSWWYDNSSANGDVYGRLYTWEAALTACPSGWSLPSDEEWKTMEMALGMSQNEADQTGYRGTDEGEKLKSTSGWFSGGNGTNSSGFTALPGGYRTTYGGFIELGYYGYWWSATAYGSTIAWYRTLIDDYDDVYRDNYVKGSGFSVRCLRD